MRISFRLRRQRGDEAGIIMVLLALGLLVVFIGFAALVIDGGNAREVQRQAQAAADAGALAGAEIIKEGGSTATARTVAAEYASQDGFPGSQTIVDIPPSSGPYAGNSACVEVITSQTQREFFAQVLHVGAFTPSALAVACANTSSGSGDSLIALSRTDCGSFFNDGNSGVNLNLNGSGVYIDSSCSTAYDNTGHSSFAFTPSSVVSIVGNESGGCTNCTFQTSQPVLPDPIAPVVTPPPTPSTAANLCTVGVGATQSVSGTITPGYYNCELDVTGTSTFDSGDYLVTGGIEITTNGGTVTFGDANGPTYFTLEGIGFDDATNSGVTFSSVRSTGVLFCLTLPATGQCSPSDPVDQCAPSSHVTCPAWLTTSNGDVWNLYPPATGYTDSGVSIWVDQSIYSSASGPPYGPPYTVGLMGNAQGAGVTGTIYVPQGSFGITANGGTYTVGSIVAQTLNFTGKSSNLTALNSATQGPSLPFAVLVQ